MQTGQDKPWYKYPWPWVAIGIPGAAVVMGITTLVLAITNPDPLTVDENTYQSIRSDLAAEQADAAAAEKEDASDSNDGDEG